MNFCNECHGLGETFNEDDSKKVCQICGGFGLIKKQGCGLEEEEGT
jgi:rRNA maturation endonuclease Nob1